MTTATVLRGEKLLVPLKKRMKKSHKKSQGTADPVIHMPCMTPATVLRGDKLLVPLKKRMERSLTNTARLRPVRHILLRDCIDAWIC